MRGVEHTATPFMVREGQPERSRREGLPPRMVSRFSEHTMTTQVQIIDLLKKYNSIMTISLAKLIFLFLFH